MSKLKRIGLWLLTYYLPVMCLFAPSWFSNESRLDSRPLWFAITFRAIMVFLFAMLLFGIIRALRAVFRLIRQNR